MTDLVDEGRPAAAGRAETAHGLRLCTLPVVLWAVVGAAVLGLQVYVFTSWFADGGYRLEKAPAAVGGGDATRPADVLVPLSSVLGVLVLAVYLYRRCRARRRLTFDALLFIGLLLASWQSPLMNWVNPVLASNVNVFGAVASWGPYVPGWQSAGPHREAELPLATLSICMTALIAAVACSKGIGMAAARRPRWGVARLVGFGFLLVMVFDLCEPLISFVGISVWTRSVPELTLWSGAWYQFPLYQMVASALFGAALGAMRHFRNARDETCLESGAGLLPRGVRPWARLLAVVGGANVCIGLYTGTHILFSLLDGGAPDRLPDFFRPPAGY
ncbi:spirocyclase AveC family protein [Streptomyces sp. LX-29]|uniref:spirocyclase AveC family protein n=1 Tax=Streptomyces sp. LX-29 TaxID=2900152 RepID=UPI00240E9956|nr:spirocyclase AveC family protein [Streptomyces sp. LX-29]WFB11172.1 spirocyclase AveC family protein [Streptomyces sp. LX-29]